MSVPGTSLERFYKECENAVRVKIDMKDQNGSFYVNQVREINILMSVCKATKLNINKIKTLGELPDRKGNWFIQLEDSVSQDELKSLIGMSGEYFDGDNKLNRRFSITDIADGDELVDMKFSVHFLPINFELGKVKEYFERIGFSSVSTFRNKIKLNRDSFDELDCQKEIFTNLIFVKAKLKKKLSSPIVCGYRKLFGYEPRIDIFDGVKRCRLCKKEGHLVDKCLGKDVYCAKCKQQGHSENECSIAYMLQKGLYSQIGNFDDSDEIKYNCLTEDILYKKKEQWEKTKNLKAKKEKEKIEKENVIQQFNKDETLDKIENQNEINDNEQNNKYSDSEMEQENSEKNDKRNHSELCP